jgi:DNA-binding NtrC family response regulator
MAFAKLVVVQGPDMGREFGVPLRGGAVGRGESCLVQLQDPSVSREHFSIQYLEGSLKLVDSGSRNRTLVNGEPVAKHALVDGDEITIGQTRLQFRQEKDQLDIVENFRPSRVTIEVGSGALLMGQTDTPLDQRRHLAAVASFGDKLHSAQNQSDLGRAACEAILTALQADRGFLLLQDKGRMIPAAAAVLPDDPAGRQVTVPADLVAKVTSENKCVAAEDIQTTSGPRAAVAAPLLATPTEAPLGLLYADKQSGSWQELDLLAMSCLGHLLSAALANLNKRESLVQENQRLSEELGKGSFVGESAPAQQLMAFVNKVGPSDATVLVTGQSGSGKEMVARAIHDASRRNGKPFVAVNCAALTESLIESELFGHEKGAFTGATERKIGRFEAANHGTLFLDEVGELPMSCQTKFLRVLEEQCFERVGGTKSIAVNVRVVAATNRDLPAMIRQGGFREDLYYRLSVIHTQVPTLAQRPSDIPVLAQHFLERQRSQVARAVTGFAPDAMQAMCSYSWPGNVRELRNAVQRAIVLGDGELLQLQDLPPELSQPGTQPSAAMPMAMPAMQVPAATPAPAPAGARPLRELEREGIVAALQATGGNKAKAAALLQIDRSTLYKKLKDYGIDS